MYIHDLANMENINDGKPPLPPPRKYLSIFRIDGEPILPPLMTTEKRRQMQKLKEQALKIEQRLRERQQRLHQHDNNNTKSDIARLPLQTAAVNISQRSQDNYANNIKETEKSMVLLKNLIQRQQAEIAEEPVESLNTTASNTSVYFHVTENQEKLQKLQKSEILIYDNSTNQVIQVPAGKEETSIEDQRSAERKLECQDNLKCLTNKKPGHLLLAGINSKGMKAIPTICLNPPTPLTVNKSMCDALSAAESSESLPTSENPNKSLDFEQDVSSDESFNSMQTQSDKKSNRIIRQHIAKFATKMERENETNVDIRSITPVRNVCAKIQQFEAISSDSNTPQTSPEKVQKNRKTCLGTPPPGSSTRK